uniref:Uncharacterized protein n=1 Tax=Meloidogyne enterolobii TaxID=390850 RepID=A0A6V7WBK1_MELEN|nr:unnamed protein product [Meloidogyne enterolobii]
MLPRTRDSILALFIKSRPRLYFPELFIFILHLFFPNLSFHYISIFLIIIHLLPFPTLITIIFIQLLLLKVHSHIFARTFPDTFTLSTLLYHTHFFLYLTPGQFIISLVS